MKVRPRQNHRIGFTLIELLVVIAIIAILIALLAGGSGCPRSCTSNAVCQQPETNGAAMLHNYHSGWNTFPVGFLARTRVSWPISSPLHDRWSVLAQMAPQLSSRPTFIMLSTSTFRSRTCRRVVPLRSGLTFRPIRR